MAVFSPSLRSLSAMANPGVDTLAYVVQEALGEASLPDRNTLRTNFLQTLTRVRDLAEKTLLSCRLAKGVLFAGTCLTLTYAATPPGLVILGAVAINWIVLNPLQSLAHDWKLVVDTTNQVSRHAVELGVLFDH